MITLPGDIVRTIFLHLTIDDIDHCYQAHKNLQCCTPSFLIDKYKHDDLPILNTCPNNWMVEYKHVYHANQTAHHVIQLFIPDDDMVYNKSKIIIVYYESDSNIIWKLFPHYKNIKEGMIEMRFNKKGSVMAQKNLTKVLYHAPQVELVDNCYRPILHHDIIKSCHVNSDTSKERIKYWQNVDPNVKDDSNDSSIPLLLTVLSGLTMLVLLYNKK